jgi:hypothetical protein
MDDFNSEMQDYLTRYNLSGLYILQNSFQGENSFTTKAWVLAGHPSWGATAGKLKQP